MTGERAGEMRRGEGRRRRRGDGRGRGEGRRRKGEERGILC
jgi:hypothetical protein